MNAKRFEKLLQKLKACADAVEWSKGKTLAEAWSVCKRADWMLWLLARMSDKPGWPKQRLVVHTICDCAETALPIWEKKYPNDKRPRNAIETARKFADGKATAKELDAARAAADAAAADAANAPNATNAAFAATFAADAAARAAHAADYAVAAAGAATDAANATAANAAARIKSLKSMSDLVRKRIGKFRALA